MNYASLQRHVAHAAVGPTTLRKMHGTTGKRASIQAFLTELDLDAFRHDFASRLSADTERLEHLLNGNWGAARKAINLTLRDATYNFWLRREYRLDEIESLLELPLDSRTMRGIIRRGGGPTEIVAVSRLNATTSEAFQDAAGRIAAADGVHRVHLDLEWWSGRDPD